MILQALVGYYKRLAEDSGADVAPEGFERKEVPFLIVLNRSGRCVGLLDTREGEGRKKRGRMFTVPKAVKKTSGIAANLLWDTPSYVLGRPKPDPKKSAAQLLERAKEQHRCFIATVKERFPEPVQDEGIRSVLLFLERGDFASLFGHTSWPEIEATGSNLAFKIEGDQGLVCQRPAVAAVMTGSGSPDTSRAAQTCLVTGEQDIPVRLHTAIKGVRNAQTSGANIVSFNLDAFRSFGKEQGLNAPVGTRAEFAYTTALNHMLSRSSRQKVQVGDATTVFWGERETALEGVFYDLFGAQPAKGEPEQDYKRLISLFRSPETGAEVQLDPTVKFFVLGLAPNAARIAIRFWYAGTVGSIANNLWQHFDDLDMVKGPKDWHRVDLRSLLRSTALRADDDNVPPNLAGDTMKSILAGTPYPQTLLSAAIRRCRAEREVTYGRAALMKAMLTRETRYYERNEKEVGMSLDTAYVNPGYLLGRLFAVLEHAQEAASPGINATIRDRFYSAASSTPVAAFPHLMKLKNFHIAKLENKGQAVNLEKQIGEITDKLPADNPFPAHLNLQDQGRFTVGYYHQRQSRFTKRESQ